MRIKHRCFELFAEKLEIGWGKAFFGMFLALDFGLDSGGVGGGGVLTTMLRKHTQQYHHKSRFTRYLRYFRDEMCLRFGDVGDEMKLRFGDVGDEMKLRFRDVGDDDVDDHDGV